MAFKIYFKLFLVIILFFGCTTKDQDNKNSHKDVDIEGNAELNLNFSFDEMVVLLPSPTQVKLEPGGYFYKRFHNNINYLRFQHDDFGEEMLNAYSHRHYSPGKLLERVWDGEYAGKWLDATTRTAVNTNNKTQLAMVDSFAASLRSYQSADGYMGIKLPKNRELNEWEEIWDTWNQWNSMIGFLTHFEFRGDSASLEAASGIGKWIVKTHGSVKDGKAGNINEEFIDVLTHVVVCGQLMRLYQHTENNDLIEFVGQVIFNDPPIQQMLSSGKPYLAHPYMLNAILYGVVEYAQVTKDKKMFARVEQVWDNLVKEQLFPTGSLGEREDLTEGGPKDIPDAQLQETCATTEWIFLTQRLYELTGKSKYMEMLEITCYNALPAAQSSDGMKWCYYTPFRYSKHFGYGPTRCCFWSGPRGIARLPQLIYATKGNNIYVNFLETSSANLTSKQGEVQIEQKSGIPAKGKSYLTIKTPIDWEGKLFIRKPVWTTNFQAKINGNTIKSSNEKHGYFDIILKDLTNYEIDIQIDILLLLKKFEGNNYVIQRGPEVLSIDARDNIDTWLGAQDDLISIPKQIKILPFDSTKRYRWVGPADTTENRRLYLIELNDARCEDPRGFMMTPYADAGNFGAAFRTIFPMEEEKNDDQEDED